MRRASLWSATVALTGAAALALAWSPTMAQAAPSPQMATSPTVAVHSHPVRNACAQSTRPGIMSCLALVRTDTEVQPEAITPDATPSGLGPSQLQDAYNLPSSTAGGGQTVAIVDAMDDPNAESDLATYRATFGLPACTTGNGCFRKVNQNGASSPLPATDTGWATEISLDVDMVSAVCPNCHILLVEASSPTTNNLGTAVNTAVALGAKFVSNSYGGGETGAASADASFYSNHPGAVITASSGDGGFGVEFPASGSKVVAVGGTSLRTAANTRGWTETVWNGAGSGCSGAIAKPSWQTDTGCSRRTVADVSAVADPNTGVAVNDTFGEPGFFVVGGTSASSPIIASVYALAGTPAAGSNPSSFPYSHTANLFDVTSGSNGNCNPAYLCTGETGYDGPTGLGTPNGVGAFTAGGGGSPPPPPPGCTSGQLIGNSGFETGSISPWSSTPAVLQNTSTGQISHTGSWFAWMDGYGTTHTDTLSQTVTIPSGCSSATYRFFLHIDTAETTTRTAFDRLTVSAGGSTLATFSNLNHIAGYASHSFNLSAFIGQTVTLSFRGTEDVSLETSFVVDDATLNVS
ncbi:MAG TPA: hypothetical protein VFX70_05025 [Mycobacteriales bacterium]|nr:hypothetical protein [Mycobacteriales bacterium]